MEREYPISYPDITNGHESEAYRRYPQFLDIERETVQILQGLSEELSIAVALAASEKNMYRKDMDWVPSIAVFSRDGKNPDQIWNSLLKVLKTPDRKTAIYNPELRPLIDSLVKMLSQLSFREGAKGAIGSLRMVRVAGGDANAIYYKYKDVARRYPEYANDWEKKLQKQFNGHLNLSSAETPAQIELAHLLEKNLSIAAHHRAIRTGPEEGEDPASYISKNLQKIGEICEINGIEELQRATAVMDRRWRAYRQEAYALRGIPFEA